MYKQKNYDNNKVRGQSLEDDITRKERMVQRIKSEIEGKDSTTFEKTTNFKAEEGQLKIRFENLKSA